MAVEYIRYRIPAEQAAAFERHERGFRSFHGAIEETRHHGKTSVAGGKRG